jgi:hypothetical protein
VRAMRIRSSGVQADFSGLASSDLVVGLSFLFFVLSIVASAVNKEIAAIFRPQARMLERAILNLITGAEGKDDAAGSPIVDALCRAVARNASDAA